MSNFVDLRTSARVSQFALGSVRLTSTDRRPAGANERCVTLMSQATRWGHQCLQLGTAFYSSVDWV